MLPRFLNRNNFFLEVKVDYSEETDRLRCSWPPWMSKNSSDMPQSRSCDPTPTKFNFPPAIREQSFTFSTPPYSTRAPPQYTTTGPVETTTETAATTRAPAASTGTKTGVHPTRSGTKSGTAAHISPPNGTATTHRPEATTKAGDSLPTWAIVVIVSCGAIILVVLILAIFLFFKCCRRKAKKGEDKPESVIKPDPSGSDGPGPSDSKDPAPPGTKDTAPSGSMDPVPPETKDPPKVREKFSTESIMLVTDFICSGGTAME